MLRTSIVLLLLLGGCDKGSTADASNPPDADGTEPAADALAGSDDTASDDAASDGAASDDGSDAATETPTPEPPKRERIRIHNSCSKPVKLRIERMNDSDSNTTLSSNTGMEERATDGDEVRLLDDSNNVVHAVKIEASMQEVDIASSCTQVVGK
jgi:hypothetical protein